MSDGTNDSNIATVSIAVGGNFGPRTNLDESPQNGMLLTGALTLSQPLTVDHELIYRSDTVDPHPIVVLETSLLSSERKRGQDSLFANSSDVRTCGRPRGRSVDPRPSR